MDDKYIDNRIKDVWQIDPSSDLLERVLAKAECEALREKPRRTVYGIAKWKFAMAGICLLAITFSNISEQATQNRIAALGGNHNIEYRTPSDIGHRDIRSLLARIPADLAEEINYYEHNQ